MNAIDFKTSALLVIDVQKDYWSFPQPIRDDFIGIIQTLVRRFKNQGATIIYVKHVSLFPWRYFQRNTPGIELMDGLIPDDNDFIIEKHTPGCFYQTDLDSILKKKGIKSVFITGLQTNHCCDTTCREASARGYSTYIVKEAVETFDINGIDGKKIERELLNYVTLSVLANGFCKIVSLDQIPEK
jgi:nicotinamidase-related amidase